jgi:DNA helicase-2/ATP-dependent DNA helicase PcrA
MRKIQLKRSRNTRLAERLERDLNDEQRAAALAPDGYNLILAGPGSGKTRVVTYRVAHLIDSGVPASSILLVTFTRRAAREMVGRLESLIGRDAQQVWAGTFHHVGNRVLRRAAEALGFAPNFTILDSEDQADLMRLAMSDAALFGAGRLAPKPAALLHLISFAANVQRPLVDVVADRAPDLLDRFREIETVAEAYAQRKRASNCMDYDDLLTQWARLLRDYPEHRAAQGQAFRHLLIDEMQDTNRMQVDLVEAIAEAGEGNLTAVGDDAQSIYRFRGADYDNILKFPDRHPGANVFHLDVNYRSTPEIVAFTRASIARNKTGFPKRLVAVRDNGLKPTVVEAGDEFEEAAFLCDAVLEAHERGEPLARMAVLYRNNYDGVVLQGELTSRGVPFSVRGGLRFFEKAHVKDVLAYTRIVCNPRDEAAWRRLLLLLPGIGQAKAALLGATIVGAGDPHAVSASGEAMKLVPTATKGFYAGFINDVKKVREVEPETHPGAAVRAVLEGGYPAILRHRYEKPEERLAEIEQLAVLAGRYASLERMINELLLAGDVYGVDTAGDEDPGDLLALSTVHQAKGLEWSRVFVARLVEETFPHYRALAESGGEEEERRLFYVAVSRAMNELTLVYPIMTTRGARGPTVLSRRSRFIGEIEASLYEAARIE